MDTANVHYNEAIRQCNDEITRNAATANTYTVLTWALRRQNRFEEVIERGEQGLGQFPNELRIVQTMGEAYFYLNDFNRSLAYMQRYLFTIPEGERSSIAFFFIGEIYRVTEKFHHADIAYTTAVHLQPYSALWWFRLASVREAVGDRNPAIDAYQQALRLNPTYTEARAGLVRVQATADN